MPSSRKALCAAAAVSLCATTAMAQELMSWGQSGVWSILVDPTLGNGCLIQTDFVDGSTVRIGFDGNTGNGYVAAFNLAWGGIDPGKLYDIAFLLDDEQFDGEATGIYLGDVPGAFIEFENPDFLGAIAQRQTMTLFNDDGEVMSIDLTGTFNGLSGALDCQEQQG